MNNLYVSKILDNLFIGNELSFTYLYNSCINCHLLINVSQDGIPFNPAPELPTSSIPNIDPECIRIPIPISTRIHICSNVLKYFSRTNNKIDEFMKSGKSVLILSSKGLDRAPTIVIAFLMSKKQMRLRQAYNFVKSKRPTIKLSNNLYNQLVIYDKWLQIKRLFTSH